MMTYLFRFVGSATRKEWWLTTLATAAAEALLWFCCPLPELCSAVSVLLLLPWLAVSSRRLQSSGNEPQKGIFCFALLPTLAFLLPLLGEHTREVAEPLVQVFMLICGIVFLSYAIICGFVEGKKA